MPKPKIKLIELSDRFVDNKFEFPYFQSINSHVRFLLRSKLGVSFEPVILIQNDVSHQSLLPLSEGFQLNSKWCIENFSVLKGEFEEDGGWVADLHSEQPGLVSFQLVFVRKEKDKQVQRFGTCDTIIFHQSKVDVRTLRKQTVFPRCIGHHSKWIDFFSRQMELGYNSFHLAPIQQTGISKSYYSLYNQLQLSNDVFQGTPQQKMSQLKAILNTMKKKGALFFIDIVLNHTSCDSDWIKYNPDSVYTVQNTPMLASAFEVDKTIYEWGNQIKEVMGATGQKMTQQQFSKHGERLWGLIAALKLEQYFQVTQDIISKFQKLVNPRKPLQNLFAKDPIQAIQQFITKNAADVGCSRKGIQIKHLETRWRTLNIAYQSRDLKKGIEAYNRKWRKKIQNEWIPQIVNNVMGEVRWNYLQNHHRDYKDLYPFVKKYFTEVVQPKGDNFSAINNGWIGGMETNVNFIYSQEFYYLRRKVQVWEDLIRVRYGKEPKDAPHSWKHMTSYIKIMAETFDGFRMDNLHGTQRHVAKYMIIEGRKVNPDLIVFAELFTDTEQQKAMFVREIGINITLKQAQHMLSGDSFIQMFHDITGSNGPYIGSLNPYFQTESNLIKYVRRKKPLYLVYDLTHDNESYFKKGIIQKQLPIALLTSFSGTFVGSTKGFDQFYNRHIQVTEQTAIYAQDKYIPPIVDNSEIYKKRIIYIDGNLKAADVKKNYEVFGSWDGWKHSAIMVEDGGVYWADLELPPGKYEYKFFQDGKWIAQNGRQLNAHFNHEFQIFKGLQKTLHSSLQGFRKSNAQKVSRYSKYRKYFAFNRKDIVIMIRQTSDHQKAICMIANLSNQSQALFGPIVLPGLLRSADVWYQTSYSAAKGITTEVEIINHSNIGEFFQVQNQGDKDALIGSVLPAGFGCLIQCTKCQRALHAIRSADEILKQPINLPPMGALDYNLLLFGISREEEIRFGESNYVLPQNRQLIYAGFGGIIKMLKDSKRQNNQSINLFDNLREGRWLLHYYVRRVKNFKNLTEIADIMERYFSVLEQLPHQLIPKYFTDFIVKFWDRVEYSICNSMNLFERKLVLATNQFISHFPHQRINFQTTISAGLPHFSTGWSRCWGRDTFISSQLLLYHPNIYRDVILQFASTLRHGLIPNLLDSGNNPRYNCRDACWWFIRGIKQYARKTGDYNIYKSKVQMLFLSNDLLQHNKRKAQGNKKIMLLEDIIQEIFQSHADGISYREWHAGYEIDSSMSTDGFTINLAVDQETGFIVGGNASNCLTWMDKMGSSSKAGTKGYPSTSRAGAPVEMVGILKHCLTAYHQLYTEGKYSYKSVCFKKRHITFQQWSEIILQNFQEYFYIPYEHQNLKLNSSMRHSSIRIRGIYKDVVNAQLPQQEYRLRPNVLIAMSLAPQLFKKQHAMSYLKNVRTHLLHEHSIGVATLASVHESLYSTYYDNDDDSDIARLAHGYSYHNGPEWVWLYGFYISALVNFKGDRMNKKQVMTLLQEHVKTIDRDQWCGLPELTNKDGEYCHFSCRTQAWSISSLILALQEIQKMEK